MKVNIISRKLIKPCTPTPQNLTKYQISLTDELGPQVNMNVILFYQPNPKPVTNHLEESLAKILPQFYPLAGRYIMKDRLVDCNDEGAEFVEADATDIDQMIDLKTKNDPLNDLLSRQFYEVDGATDPLLSIQITKFKCGGLAIGISVTHRIFDGGSFGTFIAAWSNAQRGNTIITPSFDSPSLFPGRNLGRSMGSSTRDPTIVIKRLSFNKEDIAKLRSKIRPKNGDKRVLSRVRLVSALIAKALIDVDIERYGKARDCFITQPVNMVGRLLNPPLPKHACGNFGVPSVAQCMDANETNTEISFEEMIYILGDAIDKTIAQMSSLGDDGHNLILDHLAKMRAIPETANVLMFTDRTKFGLYEADFGWGKPIWVGIGNMSSQHATTLIDNKEGDGIEAWVHLNINDVPSFERYLQLAKMESRLIKSCL
ncbi:pelargonidin 3-o-(6-caffeoylglucoside) 5-o-(6-o-malonylglucoside) 4'''-malonyltransferase [Phtheirospermum japonicum]|uniref:Pelargonidin 3-o-(6-caffeoylglucoside) 5-o-(6-o-malonylglucoside) 4'''-malonyltransferase n=1 Tax=Phtheirospermum japonicum TaxID=374723 RepID=A0A830BE51_9LAMI|nr:pelargonidin 3-o-(6-caffeoylglucoside) 5-o-(6-o-malonylglucoside) 4'''-malonyltransferase [Phtheirospermum japonicum]